MTARLVVAAGMLALFGVAGASAAPYTVRYLGSVEMIFATVPPWNSVAVGTRARIDMTFDDATPDIDPNPARGVYPWAASAFAMTIGAVSASSEAAQIEINNGWDAVAIYAGGFSGVSLLQLVRTQNSPAPEENIVVEDDVLRGFTPALEFQNSYADLYLSDGGIMRIRLDSSGLIAPPPPPPMCPGDADGNGVVNFADITNVLANFNLTCP